MGELSLVDSGREHVELRDIPGGKLEMYGGGSGPRVLLLHGSYGWWGWEPVHQRLAERFTVIAPSHPGFGQSTKIDGIDTIDDLAYFYLDVIHYLGFGPLPVVGFGLGGWIAAEMAIRCSHEIQRLMLVDSVGIKISDRETRDINDPFVLLAEQQQAVLWHDPSSYQAPLPRPGLEPAMLETMLRNQESALLYGWKPFMHNPKLRQWLPRIRVPTLVIWGADDQVVSPAYGRAFADRIHGATFVTIASAGHYPHREQTDEFVRAVADFLS